MMAPTNPDRIIDLLARHPGLDDDEISRLTGIRPRQQVNQICRRLEQQKRLARRPAASGKIGNYPIAAAAGAAEPTTRQAGPSASPPEQTAARVVPNSLRNLRRLNRTLLLIPCSGSKSSAKATAAACAPIIEDLPPGLGMQLVEARSPVLARADADESEMLPAWLRYTGQLYAAAHAALAQGVHQGLHVLVISGGYGIVKACEGIGRYSTRLHLGDWPAGLLEDVLVAYAKRHGLVSMRAFVSATTDYCRIVRRVPWYSAGIDDAIIVTPTATTGAMVKAPRAQGEALAAFLSETLDNSWRSSDGLALEYHCL